LDAHVCFAVTVANAQSGAFDSAEEAVHATCWSDKAVVWMVVIVGFSAMANCMNDAHGTVVDFLAAPINPAQPLALLPCRQTAPRVALESFQGECHAFSTMEKSEVRDAMQGTTSVEPTRDVTNRKTYPLRTGQT
jgi:hypothetical protein